MAGWEERFGDYVERLGDVLGHADRRAPLRAYTTGLLLPGERESVEPMAARVDPFRVGAAHQSLHHFVAKAAWDDATLLRAVRDYALPAMLERGPVRAWLVDDTGLPKKGKLSVGVARQYCGQLGKRDDCQVAVTLSVATGQASLPVAYRLYLPEAWAADPARRALAGVPEEVGFATKPSIALDQIGRALADGVPPGVVVTDTGYGNDTDFRDGVTALGLPYVAGIQGTTGLWPPGTGPLPAEPRSGRGRPPKRLRRDAARRPLAAGRLAAGLPAGAWKAVTWREGTAGPLASRFAAVRVRPAHDDFRLSEPRAEEWLLAEWPEGEDEPTDYWLSTLPETATLEGLVATAKLRWRIERDFEELKQELGLGHFEGRAASTTTPACASPPTASWWPSAAAFPLQTGGPGPKPPSGRPTTGRGGPPVRPERHSPGSIATLRRHLAVALMRRLPRCPCCLRAFGPQPQPMPANL